MTDDLQMAGEVTVLLVEDRTTERVAIRRMLQPASVVEANDGKQAIQLVERDEAHLFDAVLTDLTMPGVSGVELIAVLDECCQWWPCPGTMSCRPNWPRCRSCGSRSTCQSWCERSSLWCSGPWNSNAGRGRPEPMRPNRGRWLNGSRWSPRSSGRRPLIRYLLCFAFGRQWTSRADRVGSTRDGHRWRERRSPPRSQPDAPIRSLTATPGGRGIKSRR